MNVEPLRHSETVAPKTVFPKPPNCPLAKCSAILMYERELEKHSFIEDELRKSVIREDALLREKEDLIQQKDILSKESEHRLLNGLQLITSLLSIQSRAIKNPEAAAQLTNAANRVAAIERVHRLLHSLDNVKSVEFKQYLKSLCHDLSGMASNDSTLVVEGIELRIPTRKGIPLGLIASELITNSIKYAKGTITVRLETAVGEGYVLSVTDDGPGLPEGFNPAGMNGLGMKLISSLISQIDGQLLLSRGDNGKGTRITVLFS
jgi:two-component system, sensor histidine kinase PdtaS